MDSQHWAFLKTTGAMALAGHATAGSLVAHRGLDGLRAGFLDGGLKDTVLVLPEERVRVLLTFNVFCGLFLYHCHNLVHEDMGMMRNFRVA